MKIVIEILKHTAHYLRESVKENQSKYMVTELACSVSLKDNYTGIEMS